MSLVKRYGLEEKWDIDVIFGLWVCVFLYYFYKERKLVDCFYYKKFERIGFWRLYFYC